MRHDGAKIMGMKKEITILTYVSLALTLIAAMLFVTIYTNLFSAFDVIGGAFVYAFTDISGPKIFIDIVFLLLPIIVIAVFTIIYLILIKLYALKASYSNAVINIICLIICSLILFVFLSPYSPEWIESIGVEIWNSKEVSKAIIYTSIALSSLAILIIIIAFALNILFIYTLNHRKKENEKVKLKISTMLSSLALLKKEEDERQKKEESEMAAKAKPASKTPAKASAKSPAKPAQKPVKEEKVVEEEDVKVNRNVYHISKRASDDKWQVKKEGAEKAVKLFKTKAAAMEYVKTLAENQGASTAFHASKGKNKGRIQKA